MTANLHFLIKLAASFYERGLGYANQMVVYERLGEFGNKFHKCKKKKKEREREKMRGGRERDIVPLAPFRLISLRRKRRGGERWRQLSETGKIHCED